MKILIIFILFIPSSAYSLIKLSDLDFLRKNSMENYISIIKSGENYCNNFFASKIDLKHQNTSYKNLFSCKFSKKRNRFYIYMLSENKIEKEPVKIYCQKLIKKWPIILDHIDDFGFNVKKEYLSGFFIENIYNNKVLDFSADEEQNLQIINNEINQFIIKRRNIFSLNDGENNKILENEISKIKRIYTKILSDKESNLEKLIEMNLSKIVRYKIFVNDVKNFRSFSCNWSPGKGLDPYVKKEKFKEFENI